MNRQLSKETMYLHLVISSVLDSHLKEIQGNVDVDEFKVLQKNTGIIMGQIYTLFLSPIWDEHVDLKPVKLGGDFVVNEDLQRKAVEFLKNLLHE